MKNNDLISLFANHRVASNLLMMMMIIVGLLALKKHQVLFFPNFELDVISISTTWAGASAEDIQSAITIPLEQRLKAIDFLDEISSSSAPSISGITLNFEDDVDISKALEQVKKAVEGFKNLPVDAIKPIVTQAIRYESVARLLIKINSNNDVNNLAELRTIARQFESQLLDRGIDKIDIIGLPKQKLSISVSSEQMQRLGLSWAQLGQKINLASQDVPAGLIGENDATRELRSLNKARSAEDFKQISIVSEHNQYLKLGDIADVQLNVDPGQTSIRSNNQLSVVLALRRNESGDSLDAAKILQQWVDDTKPILPPTVHIKVFNERWQLIRDRITLLLKNGAGGLVLVLLILYLFLSSRVAFWVAVGIPVSFMATLAVLYAVGGSINMISLFALIMALGIIVDDAIVVGEDAQAHFDQGEDPLLASEGGARRMLAPVMASSLTTIAAFLPLMLIGGRMGNIMIAIPIVIISVIIASLIESFLILPGHLKNAFKGVDRNKKSKIRTKLDNAFEYFREQLFRPLVTKAIDHRITTISIAIGLLIFAIGLFAGGRIAWQFFPSPESTTVNANVRFVSGTPEATVKQFLDHIEEGLNKAINDFDEKIIDTHYVLFGSSSGRSRAIKGSRNGSVYVELLPSDSRQTLNVDFIKAWHSHIKPIAGIDNFTIASRRVGPSSRDINIKLSGANANQLKLASLSLQEALKGIEGVSALDDDLPYGREQLIFDLTDEGLALGLNTQDLGQQIRHAYSGIVIQRFQQGVEEIDVRLQLAIAEQQSLTSLARLPIKLPSGDLVPLETVAFWTPKQGFESLRHKDGLLTVSVTGSVDAEVNNTSEIVSDLKLHVLPNLEQKFGVEYSLGGRAASQKETLSDMKLGVYIALLLMYFVLTWVFSSYGWPLLVMLTIPLGLTGAVLGHWFMGMNMTILSLFGFFALSGIVVNDSIILVTFYKQIKDKAASIKEALIEAACQRLRAVLLTSLTTIAGLTPLLFETSRQAQFLIPMATSIAFGLSFATLLILFVLPAFLSLYEDIALNIKTKLASGSITS